MSERKPRLFDALSTRLRNTLLTHCAENEINPDAVDVFELRAIDLTWFAREPNVGRTTIEEFVRVFGPADRYRFSGSQGHHGSDRYEMDLSVTVGG